MNNQSSNYQKGFIFFLKIYGFCSQLKYNKLNDQSDKNIITQNQINQPNQSKKTKFKITLLGRPFDIHTMLDYFATRQQQTNKSPLIRKPHITYGMSIQAPQEFQKPFSMISRETFVNPYLSYEKNLKTIIPQRRRSDINPVWTKKIDINQIQTERTFLKPQNKIGLLNPHSRYYKELSESKSRFRLTKGEFTNFLERNHSIELFGPLQGKQRNKTKSLLTRNQIANKSHTKLSQNFDKLARHTSRLLQSKEPFQEKHLLQKTRFSFRQSHKRELQQRKTRKIVPYLLPHLSLNSSNMNETLYSDTDFNQNLERTLLSNKSIEKLNDLRNFHHTQRYFTLKAKP